MIDGSWKSTAQFSGYGWVWLDSLGKVQLMGKQNHIRRESALHSEMEALRCAMENMLQSKLWNGLQGFDCNDQRVSCLAKLCDRIGEDRDFEDMLPGFQDYSYSTSADSNFRFLT